MGANHKRFFGKNIFCKMNKYNCFPGDLWGDSWLAIALELIVEATDPMSLPQSNDTLQVYGVRECGEESGVSGWQCCWVTRWHPCWWMLVSWREAATERMIALWRGDILGDFWAHGIQHYIAASSNIGLQNKILFIGPNVFYNIPDFLIVIRWR